MIFRSSVLSVKLWAQWGIFVMLTLVMGNYNSSHNDVILLQVHLNKLECREHFFSCNLFQKVKLSYILDSLHVKQNISKVFFFLF